MNMRVVRYINNEPYRGEKLPAIEVENPGVIMVLKDLQHRLVQTSETKVSGEVAGKIRH